MDGKRLSSVGLALVLVLLCSIGILAEEVLVQDCIEEPGMAFMWSEEERLAFEGILKQKTEYEKDLERLALLGLLPDMEVNWDEYATWKLMAGILAELNEKKLGIVPENLMYNASSDPITYYDAATVLVELLNHGKKKDPDSIKTLKKLGIKVNKVDIYDYLTGNELAHLFYKTLHQKQIDHKKSILEDVYISHFKLEKSKILRLLADSIEMEYQGIFGLSDNLIVLKLDFENGEYTPVPYSSLTVGMDNVYLVVDGQNVVQNIIVEGEFAPQKVRVLISSSLSSWGSSSSYDFDSIRLSADKELTVLTKSPVGDKVLEVVAPGTVVIFTNINDEIYYNGVYAGKRVFIQSEEAAQTTIYSTTRRGNYPQYDGNFEIITSDTQGKMYLINELAMRDYLHRVVPSEMPGYWEVEALKVQAIAARSYAYNQILHSKYGSKSANVDDSTNTQVYNNLPETPNVVEAVNATEGIIMTHNGECITAVYHSTSAGYTANNEEVWHDAATKSFPGAPLPYLRAKKLIPDYQYPNFNDEVATLAYYKEVPFRGYDYVSPWYRWYVTLTREEFENTVSKNLVARERADGILGTDFVQTIEGPAPVDSNFHIGTLEEIRVIQRGEGGNIMNLEIRASNGVWRVLKEYNIRFVIRPHRAYTGFNNVILHVHTGGTYVNYSILPSAFAAFETIKGDDGLISEITIYGGGNGHGVGMSQWGVRGMALAGLTYEEMLHSFYTDIELTKLW